jgi:hypothetical protein
MLATRPLRNVIQLDYRHSHVTLYVLIRSYRRTEVGKLSYRMLDPYFIHKLHFCVLATLKVGYPTHKDVLTKRNINVNTD